MCDYSKVTVVERDCAATVARVPADDEDYTASRSRSRSRSSSVREEWSNDGETAAVMPTCHTWWLPSYTVACKTEADLGMFSMFGRTGAPTKKGPPQEDLQIFATEQHAGNNWNNNKTILCGALAS